MDESPTASPSDLQAKLQGVEVYRALIEGMLDPVLAIDIQGTVLMASRSVRDVFGWEPAELLGRNIKLLMPEPHRSAHDDYLSQYRRTGETNILGRTREFQVLRKDGEPIEVELSVARVDPPDEGPPLFIGSFRDVTDRRKAARAERSMLRALAAIGESSAILVHEIKNPVTAINMALRAVADKLGEDEQEVLEELASRMRKLELQMRQTLSFAKPLHLKMGTCRAADLVEDVGRALKPILLKAGVSLHGHIGPDAPEFRGDLARLEEVLTNLVTNAVEMLPSGGNVHVTARPDGRNHIIFEIEDDGPGVAGSIRDTLFKPYVTTKQQGTGLGLPICRRIIEEHGGTIEVAQDRDPRQSKTDGACFRIRLPVSGPTESGEP